MPGCGPYQLARWEKDRYLSFRRKAHWWAEGVRPTPFVLRAKPQQLDFVIIPDDATATLALRRGEIDLYPQVPAAEFARLRQSAAARRELAFYSTPSYDVATAGFNTRHPALADAGTRQALSRLFDAEGLLRATQRSEGRRTVGLISPSDQLNYNDSLSLRALRPRPGGGFAAPGRLATARPGRLATARLLIKLHTNATLALTLPQLMTRCLKPWRCNSGRRRQIWLFPSSYCPPRRLRFFGGVARGRF